jgi:hypothetical protein
MSITVGYSYDTATQDAAVLETAAREAPIVEITTCEAATSIPAATIHDAATGSRAGSVHGDTTPDIAISGAAAREVAIRKTAAQRPNTQRGLAAREIAHDAAATRFLARQDAAAREVSARDDIVRDTIAPAQQPDTQRGLAASEIAHDATATRFLACQDAAAREVTGQITSSAWDDIAHDTIAPAQRPGTQRGLAAREIAHDAAATRFLARQDAAAREVTGQVTSSARDDIVRDTVARAVAARAGARIGVFSRPSVPAGTSVAVVSNTDTPILSPPTLAIPAQIVSTTGARHRSTDRLATFHAIGRSTITATHTQCSATSMAPDRGSNGVRASTTFRAPNHPQHAVVSNTAGFNGVRTSTTFRAPDHPHAVVSSAAGSNGVRTATANGRRALIPTARLAAANQQAQDATAHRLAARDERGRRAEARVIQADRNAIIEQAEDTEMIHYLRGELFSIPCL